METAINQRSHKVIKMDCMHFNRLKTLLKTKEVSEEHYKWVWENSERIDATIELISDLNLKSYSIAEIGPGGLGLAALQNFPDVKLEAYDCVEWFKPVYDQFDISWNDLDLNNNIDFPEEKYDIILLCEVIEYLAHWPIEIFKNLTKGLKSGGLLLVTTQNLHRLSNRLRMILGKKMFADFIPESLVMGHLREYMPEEMTLLMEHAGFTDIQTKFACFPDLVSSSTIQKGYSILCRVSPRLSNHFFCWGYKP